MFSTESEMLELVNKTLEKISSFPEGKRQFHQPLESAWCFSFPCNSAPGQYLLMPHLIIQRLDVCILLLFCNFIHCIQENSSSGNAQQFEDIYFPDSLNRRNLPLNSIYDLKLTLKR